MSEPEHELEQLLGGFAADTLTPEERETLFRAALQDQQLFNALADEQALKELLTDPAVRRRLLQSLARQEGAGSSPSWRNWFARPAGLAWAGGLAAGVFAVILGLKVYKDGLHQAAGPAATEEERPTTPSRPPQAAPPVQALLKDTEPKASKSAPLPETAAKDAVASASNTREKAAASRPPQAPHSSADATEKQESSRQKESQKRDATVGTLGKSAEQPAPAAPTSELDRLLLAEEKTEQPDLSVSARALFLGQPPASGIASRTQGDEGESAPKADRFALAQKAPQRQPVLKPLALRYTFVAGEKGESPGSVMLTVESNQEAYLQIWTRAGDALPELVLPAKETGRISLKTVAGQRQEIKVSQESDRVILRLSRVPFGPITRQEAVMAGRSAPNQVTESASTAQEQATYAANPNLSAAELAVEIPLSTYPSR
jgi:hypothetical protein